MFARKEHTINEINELPDVTFGDEELSDLTTDEIPKLREILSIKKHKELTARLKHFFAERNQESEFEYDQFIKRIRTRYKHILKDNKITDSFFSTLNDTPSYIGMTLVGILDVASLTTLALSMVTAALTVIMLVAGILHFIAEYKERQKERADNKKYFDIITIKTVCSEAIIKTISHNPDQPHPTSGSNYKPYVEKNKLIKMKPALGAAIMTTTMLLGTYYLGATIIVTAFGLTALATAMLGPIGLGIAIGLSLIIGVYCGYKHYQSIINEEKIVRLKKNMKNELKKNVEQCDDLIEATLTNTIDSTYTPQTLVPTPTPAHATTRARSSSDSDINLPHKEAKNKNRMFTMKQMQQQQHPHHLPKTKPKH